MRLEYAYITPLEVIPLSLIHIYHMEVKNAYSGGPIYNANLFISQYCAAKDKDFESISLNDLAATLRAVSYTHLSNE